MQYSFKMLCVEYVFSTGFTKGNILWDLLILFLSLDKEAAPRRGALLFVAFFLLYF